MCFASASQFTFSTTLRRSTGSAHGQQRGHARNAALCLSCAARCGSTYQTSPLWSYRRPVGASQWRKRSTAIAKRPRCCRVTSASSAAMYRRQSLHFVAAAPDRLIVPGRLWIRQTTRPHQQRRPIEQRGHALWPVVALLSAAHHRLRFSSRVALASACGSASPHAKAREVHRQCSASVSQRAVARIWCRLASHRAGGVCNRRWRSSQLRQSYITPHCIKFTASQSQAPLCPCTASRPAGLRSRRYAKLPTLVRWLSWRCGLIQALRAVFWSVACGQSLRVSPCPPAGASPGNAVPIWRSSKKGEPHLFDILAGFVPHPFMTLYSVSK